MPWDIHTSLRAPVSSHRWLSSRRSPPRPSPRAIAALSPTSVAAALARRGECFVENRGQADPHAAFYLDEPGATVYFSPEGVTFALRGRTPWSLKLDFVGASPGARPTGRGSGAGAASYFRGDPRHWTTGVRTYDEIVYPDLWPGIDLALRASDGRLKYEFLVRPCADPSAVRLAYRGATQVSIDGAGAAVISTPAGDLADEAPRAFQSSGASETTVPVAYALDGSSVAFRVGEYDRTRPLVLDPAIVYSGFVGGSGPDAVAGIAVGPDGSAYVAGTTYSSEGMGFPVAAGPDTTFNANSHSCGEFQAYIDAFVAKVKANGSGLEFAGFLAGSDDDTALAVAVDRGNVYVAGLTSSTESSFPVSHGPGLTQKGLADAFVTKLSSGPPGPSISSVAKQGKKLVVTGDNFASGAVILVNGTSHKTKADTRQPSKVLKSAKAGKAVKTGDKVKVRNPDGAESNEVTFAT